MSGRVAGKAALVTGGAGGLGQAIARMLAREGARVAVTDVDEAGAAAVARSINDEIAGAAVALRHDVTDEADWSAVVAATVEAFGGLSVLVNNAGIGGRLAFAEDETLENWRRVHAVNLESVMLGAKHAMAALRQSPPAAIVNISSIAGLAAAPGMGAYNASKAAVWLYTKTLALECAKRGWDIRVNSVHPCFIQTPILDPFVALAGGDAAAAHQKLARGIPLGRIGDPDDVAYAVLYLASDESRFVTGSELKIDGGMTAQ